MTHRAVVLAIVLLLAPFAMGQASATGSSQETATPIGEGTFNGTVARNDEHWYAVDVPAGKVLHVAYQRVSGDDWDDLDLFDATGAWVDYAPSGSSAVFDPDDAQVWIRLAPWWVNLTYSFTVSLLNAPPQDDGGTGQDAGQRQEFALAVQPGHITGTMRSDAGDVADWFRLDLPAGTILDLHSAQNAHVYVIAPNGRELGWISAYESSHFPRAFSIQSTGEPIFLAPRYADTYAFGVDVSLPGDLRVQSVEIRERPIETAAGAAEVSVSREVVVTLANVGAGPSRAAWLNVTTEHEGPTGIRTLYDDAVEVASGQTVVIAFPWDHTGQVGDFDIVARVTNVYDADVDDNEARAASFVLVGGLPYGLDPLNHEVRVANAATVRFEHGERTGVQTPAGFVGFDDGKLSVA